MKSERRHELEKNELADWLAGVVNQIKPYQNLLLGTAVFALVVVLIYAWSARYSAGQMADGWNEFNEAFSLGASGANFEDIVEKYPDSQLGHWAGVMAGDFYLASGCDQLFLNKADAFRDLKRAAEHYTNVLEKARPSMIRERATYGLARAREAMARDAKDVETAAKEYEKVFTNWPEGAFASVARQRFDSLNRHSAVEVYERFAQYEPKPSFQDEPGIPGQRPAFDLDALPDDAPLFTPSVNLEGPSTVVPGVAAEPGDGEMPPRADVPLAPDVPPAVDAPPATDAPPAAEPAAEDAAPGDTAPAAEQPAAEQPAAEQPAAEQPAAEQPAAEEPAAEEPAAEEPMAPAAEEPAAPADEGPMAPGDESPDAEPAPEASPATDPIPSDPAAEDEN